LIDQTLINSGFPLAVGGLLGFALGWLCRKIIKITIVGFGLILALLAYLEYHKTISVNWNVVDHQASTLLHTISTKMLGIVNNVSTDLHSHASANAFPILGVASFIPGFIFGITRG
jgi:uncharacterized membrane protein (Fun14 family)